MLAVVNRFPTWYFTAFFAWLGNLQFTGIKIYFKSVLIFRDLSFCLWFFCQSIAQITVLKDNRQQCLYELMKMKKISLFIFLTHQCDHHHYAMDSTTYLEKYGNLIFFIFQVCQYLDKINPFSKRKSIICFINNTFSNRYCLISSQYAGNVLILQTVF